MDGLLEKHITPIIELMKYLVELLEEAYGAPEEGTDGNSPETQEDQHMRSKESQDLDFARACLV